MQDLKIAELARAGGVGVETVRYYQRRGLLETPERPGNGGHSGSIRRYGDRDVRKLRFIRSAQAAGFTLEQIAELIALDATEERARAHIDAGAAREGDGPRLRYVTSSEPSGERPSMRGALAFMVIGGALLAAITRSPREHCCSTFALCCVIDPQWAVDRALQLADARPPPWI